ncbi:energy transducer TonB [Marinibactrum halimedae]|uniref:TonB C-terminal domain-containing protein n=1 Tax=Marinibactrum halimedae TaxID=1444977 RepID=A0AA37WMK1_9GAMM|nr:energy transducer TonB [Marinibactrum halimedae]MCD9459246.1 energy transducer TonB [Marinibactrum halimedae]GLS27319.1 hypothetical protein GCM10007877_30380 [Marinibactrum halimedae]
MLTLSRICSRTISFLFAVFLFSSQLEAAPTTFGVATYAPYGHPEYIAAIMVEDSSTITSIEELIKSTVSIEMRVTAERINKKRFFRELTQQISINVDYSKLQYNHSLLSAFETSIQGSLFKHDHLRLTRRENQTNIYVNNILLANVPSSRLLELTVEGWIGAVPPSREFKAEILSGFINYDLVRQLKDNQFTLERVYEIAQWQPEIALDDISLAGIVMEDTIAHSGVLTTSLGIASDHNRSNQQSRVSHADPTEILKKEYFRTAEVNINQYKRIPRFGLRNNAEVAMALEVHRTGTIISAIIENPSQYPAVNQQALEAVRKASPLPPIPDDIDGDKLRWNLTLKYPQQI